MATLVYFGTTSGLETLQLPIGGSVSPQEIALPDAWVEISNSFGRLSPESPLFLFFRRTVRGVQCSWIALYMSVNEIGYQRGGGFYGAGLWFSGAPINGQEALSHLLKASEALKKLAVDQGAFQRRIAEIELMLRPTVDPFCSLFGGSVLASGGCLPAESESVAFIGVEGAGAVEVFEWAQRSSSAAAFSKVIFGSPAQRPEGGRIPQDRIFRSLALAIEAAHRARVVVFTDQLENLQDRLAETEADYRAQVDRNRGLAQRNEELERVLHQRVPGFYQTQFRSPTRPVLRAPVNPSGGEPSSVTFAGEAASTRRLVGGQQSNDVAKWSGDPESRPPMDRSGGWWRVVYIILFIILAFLVWAIFQTL